MIGRGMSKGGKLIRQGRKQPRSFSLPHSQVAYTSCPFSI